VAEDHVLAVDLATVWEKPDRKLFIRVIGWGAPLEVLNVTADHVEVRVWRFKKQPDGSEKPIPASGFIVPKKTSGIKTAEVAVHKSDNTVLKMDFVDVQQGDASVLESPGGKVVLIDGGDNQLFARYLAGRFRRTSDAKPLKPEAIVITHGDADHFLGLTEIQKSETIATTWKRLFLAPKRVLHNGLVKRPENKPDGKSRPEAEMFGAVSGTGSDRVITDLVDDVRTVPDAEMNEPFRRWRDALNAWAARGQIDCEHISRGSNALGFLASEGIMVEVLGPILTSKNGATGLALLGDPPEGPRLGVESEHAGRKFSGVSASHTINGHSIILRVTYGDVRFLLTGDLNEQAAITLRDAVDANGDPQLAAHVFKVPHHGSADFDPVFLDKVAPVVSVVSSGDENARKEYIHPRATLVGSLGRASRVNEPLVFVTELVAFFEVVGWVDPEKHVMDALGDAIIQNGKAVDRPAKDQRPTFFAFDRRAFGIVRVRTDGHRLFVFTDSGHEDLKEAYAYTVVGGVVTPTPVLSA
jgi:beta-lactamase superfamily II metal-dependent hydrolase